jgi:integrase/recombinase XerC
LSALRSFFNFLLQRSRRSTNPAVGVQAPKASKRLPQTIDVRPDGALLEFRADTN